jgi:hypothetical protein
MGYVLIRIVDAEQQIVVWDGDVEEDVISIMMRMILVL